MKGSDSSTDGTDAETAPGTTGRERTAGTVGRRGFLRRAAAAGAVSAGGLAATAGTAAASHDYGRRCFLWAEYEDYFHDTWKQGINERVVTSPRVGGKYGLEVTFPEGSHYGMDAHYEPHNDPEFGVSSRRDELWTSYDILVPEDFSAQAGADGKFPGLADTRRGGGFGLKRSDGYNGWSARVGFSGAGSGRIGLHAYVYHMDQNNDWGEWFTGTTCRKGRWHSVAQHVVMNSPGGSGRRDGRFEMYVDGERVIDRRRMRFRATDELGANSFWFNQYFGGGDTSPKTQQVYYDNVRISTEPLV